MSPTKEPQMPPAPSITMILIFAVIMAGIGIWSHLNPINDEEN